MHQRFIFPFILILTVTILGNYSWYWLQNYNSGAPPYGEPESAAPAENEARAWWLDWERPAGPARVGIQIGHLDSKDHPEELAKLRGNTGANGGGYSEAEVNQAVALAMKQILEAEGILVDIIPATVQPDYWADVFIAIHADGSEDLKTSGYKFAGPWRDLSKKGGKLVQMLNDSYGEATGLAFDPNISRNMRGYYAFAWWRYDHSIHPMTTAVIAETGFLTNPADRKIIVDQPELVAQTISNVLIEHLKNEGLV